jgi:hypothetical protein
MFPRESSTSHIEFPIFLRAFAQSPEVGRMPASEIHIIRKRRDSKRGRRTREALRLDSAEIVL